MYIKISELMCINLRNDRLNDHQFLNEKKYVSYFLYAVYFYMQYMRSASNQKRGSESQSRCVENIQFLMLNPLFLLRMVEYFRKIHYDIALLYFLSVKNIMRPKDYRDY